MKKIFAGALVGALVLSLAACGGKTTDETSQGAIDKMGESISLEESSKEAVSSEAADANQESANAGEESQQAAPAVDFSGIYSEPLAGRCTITIESTGNNTYKVSVHWSSSAFESANWEMDATYYDSTTLLEYTDAKYFVRTYTDEDNYTDDVQYENGAGEFWFEEDGKLGWRSANMEVDGITGETEIVNNSWQFFYKGFSFYATLFSAS